jgi:hypothetical protein
LRAERLRGIGLHAHVDDGRLAVGVRHEVAHVVVIVALTVVASLRGQVPSTPLSESGPVKGLPTYGLINNLSHAHRRGASRQAC